MFVLLGEQLPGILSGALEAVRQSNHEDPWWLAVYVLAITVGLAALRFAWVWVAVRLNVLAAQLAGEVPAEKPDWRLIAAMSVAGVRGAITLAGVLTLPLLLSDGTPFPARDLTIFLAAGVIILSLIIASFVLPHFLDDLQLPSESARDEQEERARVAAADAAIRAVEGALHDMVIGQPDAAVHAETAARVIDLYRRRVEGHNTSENAARIRRSDDIEHQLRLVGLRAERDIYFSLARANAISDASSRKLVREIDLMEERIG
jgi:CPA1 family monovalent cation:H+ antiporter